MNKEKSILIVFCLIMSTSSGHRQKVKMLLQNDTEHKDFKRIQTKSGDKSDDDGTELGESCPWLGDSLESGCNLHL